jgi:predicted CXXCH cytochrome family protein
MRIESRAVKKLLLIGVGSALMFTMGGVGPAQADTVWTPIHTSTAGLANSTQDVAQAGTRCAGCHRAHTAKGESLLKQAQPALCYSCHSALGSALDVVDGVSVAGSLTPQALRGGGFEYALIDGAKAIKTLGSVDANGRISHTGNVAVGAKAAVTSEHAINGTTQGTMWGNGAISTAIATTTPGELAAGKTGVTLECGSCHDPHGNGNYRILRPIPNDAATKASTGVAAVVVLPVNIPDEVADGSGHKVYTTTNYWNVNDRRVPLTTGGTLPINSAPAVMDNTTVPPTVVTPAVVGTTDGFITNIAQWCTTCHTRYLAASGSYNTPNKGYVAAVGTTAGSNATTGPTDATFTYRHRSDSVGESEKPNCIQCHVSHGSNVDTTASVGVSSPDGGVVPASDSRLLRVNNRGTCEMCHNV